MMASGCNRQNSLDAILLPSVFYKAITLHNTILCLSIYFRDSSIHERTHPRTSRSMNLELFTRLEQLIYYAYDEIYFPNQISRLTYQMIASSVVKLRF